MNYKINKLEDLIKLYKSNAITKEEYEILKKELLSEITNIKENRDSNSIKSESKSNIFEEINLNERQVNKSLNKPNKKLSNSSKLILFLFISGFSLIFFVHYIDSSYKREIEKICLDCEEFQKVRKSTFVLVKNKEGKSNVYDTKINRFLLNNWYEANYDEGTFYDDITFKVNGKNVMCSDNNYHYLSEQGDNYLVSTSNSLSSSTSSSSTSTSTSTSLKTCSWCSKEFSGEHYTHLGKMSDCYTTNSSSSIGMYCSSKCCSEARKSSCPTCR